MAAVLRLQLGLSCRRSWRFLTPGRRESGTGTTQEDLGEPMARPPLRSRKYQPSAQLEERVREALERVTGSPATPGWQETRLGEGERYHLLCDLAHELSHLVPNSQLHQMRTPGDLLHFYQQPTNADPFVFQELAHSELPQNLRITWVYEGSGARGGDGLNPG